MQQIEFFGYGSIWNLPQILEKERIRNIFLISGKESYAECGAEEHMKNILSPYKVSRFHDFEENPKFHDVERGVNLIRNAPYDLVIAIGGGTVMDLAKLVNILSSQEGNILPYINGEKKIQNNGRPLITIPTTAGTGSEATHFSVIYIGKEKHSIAHNFMLPDYSIVDPTLTFSLPLRVSASTGIDALSQAIESYWCVNSTSESKEYAKEAVKLVIGNLKNVVLNPLGESRLLMARAANLAGKAINLTKTTAPHAISYSFTAYFGIPHGHAVGLTLGKILMYNSKVKENDCNDPKGVEYVRKTMNELINIMGCKNADEASQKVYSLMNNVGLKTKLSELGINKDSLKIIINNFNPDRISNNPRVLDEEEIKRIIDEIY